jgi:hypothetical protein
MANTSYYATDGGFDYETFADHFMKQAEGENKPLLVQNMTNMATFSKSDNGGRGRIVLINTRKDNNKLAKGATVAKLEVIDPAEGARRRAVAEVHNKEADKTTSTHSRTSKRKRNTTSTTQQKKKKTAVKHTSSSNSDIFGN